MKTCSNCNHQVDDDCKFCPECGYKFPIEKFCPNCGNKLSENAKFCPECGCKIVNDKPSNVDSLFSLGSSSDDDLFKIDSTIDNKINKENDYKKKIDLAYSYCLREMFDQAKKIYEEIIEEDPLNEEVFLGLLRAETKNFTQYEGTNIDNALKAVEKVTKDLSALKEYQDYILNRKKYFDNLKINYNLKKENDKSFDEEKYDLIDVDVYKIFATEKNDAECQYKLGKILMERINRNRNYKEAFKWFKLASEQNYPAGLNALGVLYSYGFGVDKDINKAIELFKKSAEQNYAKAQCNLANLYRVGEGVIQDKKEAIRLYRLSAEQGYTNAQYVLACMYDMGDGIPQDKKEANKWYELANEHKEKIGDSPF